MKTIANNATSVTESRQKERDFWAEARECKHGSLMCLSVLCVLPIIYLLDRFRVTSILTDPNGKIDGAGLIAMCCIGAGLLVATLSSAFGFFEMLAEHNTQEIKKLLAKNS